MVQDTIVKPQGWDSVAPDFDIRSLMDMVPEEYRDHPVLDEELTWHAVFSQAGCGRTWAYRYARELTEAGIRTVGDFAVAVMALQLEDCAGRGCEYVCRFHKPMPDGTRLMVQTKHFGDWAWRTALFQLYSRDLDWQEFHIERRRAAALHDAVAESAVPEPYKGHPILLDDRKWVDIFKAAGAGSRWYGSYRKELARDGIVTVADMARAIMSMKLEYLGSGPIYRFHKNPADGQPLELNKSNFGRRAWQITLAELEERDFNWRAFLVE